MRVLVLASQKGGAGKTTLTAHLAVEAKRSGVGTVAIIDTDPQQGLTGWWRVRPGESILLARVLHTGLAATLKELRENGVDLVIIDTPPAITASIRDTVRQAGIVLVPVKPSPNDLRAVGATVDIVAGERRPIIFGINQATARARLTGEAAISLSQHGIVAPSILHHRVDFAACMSDGRVAAELDPKSKSAGEVAALWTYIASKFTENENYARTPN